MDEHAGVTKELRWEDRDGDERQPLIFGDHIVGHRQFGDIELTPAEHARVTYLGGHIRQDRKLDTFRLDGPFFQWANTFVIAGGECQF